MLNRIAVSQQAGIGEPFAECGKDSHATYRESTGSATSVEDNFCRRLTGRCYDAVVMAVDRCVCHDITFAELLRRARDAELTFEELQARTGCATGCALCEPYIRLALATGRSTFPVLDEEGMKRIRRAAERSSGTRAG